MYYNTYKSDRKNKRRWEDENHDCDGVQGPVYVYVQLSVPVFAEGLFALRHTRISVEERRTGRGDAKHFVPFSYGNLPAGQRLLRGTAGRTDTNEAGVMPADSRKKESQMRHAGATRATDRCRAETPIPLPFDAHKEEFL